jgi:methylthioribose-1-phosphate isomerase
MKVGDTHYRSIWFDGETARVKIIDQRWLPHEFRVVDWTPLANSPTAIRRHVGARRAADRCDGRLWVAHGDAAQPSDEALDNAWERLHETRPTAINLRWALDEMRGLLSSLPESERARAAALPQGPGDLRRRCRDQPHDRRARPGNRRGRSRRPRSRGMPVNILTHCNAGWLATVDWGTATSADVPRPRPRAFPIHVWVDETRPRNQGAQLTSWEMNSHGIPHHLHRRQCRRASDAARPGRHGHRRHRPHHRAGDVCNKIGTYLKALAAHMTTTCRSTSRFRRAPSTGPSTTACRNPDRGAR